MSVPRDVSAPPCILVRNVFVILRTRLLCGPFGGVCLVGPDRLFLVLSTGTTTASSVGCRDMIAARLSFHCAKAKLLGSPASTAAFTWRDRSSAMLYARVRSSGGLPRLPALLRAPCTHRLLLTSFFLSLIPIPPAHAIIALFLASHTFTPAFASRTAAALILPWAIRVAVAVTCLGTIPSHVHSGSQPGGGVSMYPVAWAASVLPSAQRRRTPSSACCLTSSVTEQCAMACETVSTVSQQHPARVHRPISEHTQRPLPMRVPYMYSYALPARTRLLSCRCVGSMPAINRTLNRCEALLIAITCRLMAGSVICSIACTLRIVVVSLCAID